MAGPTLAGIRIVVTRAREQAGALASKLAALGAEVIEFPIIEIRPAENYRPLDEAIRQLASYDWLIFTSANGVRFFVERLRQCGGDLGHLRARICAIGPATRREVEALNLKVDLMPAEYVAESLVEAFRSENLSGKRILLPRAAIARDVVPVELAARGAQVDVAEAYRTVIPDGARDLAARIFGGAQRPDWITFTSSSTVTNFVAAVGAASLDGVRVASIGPVTTATARKHGVDVTVEASKFTIDGLIQAIIENTRR